MIIMLSQEDISEVVMRRVLTVYFFRRLVYPVIAEVTAIFSIGIVLALSVSFGDVLANVKSVSSVSAFFHYVFSAIMQTELLLQLFLLVGIGISTFFVWQVSRTVKTARSSFAEV